MKSKYDVFFVITAPTTLSMYLVAVSHIWHWQSEFGSRPAGYVTSLKPCFSRMRYPTAPKHSIGFELKYEVLP